MTFHLDVYYMNDFYPDVYYMNEFLYRYLLREWLFSN